MIMFLFEIVLLFDDICNLVKFMLGFDEEVVLKVWVCDVELIKFVGLFGWLEDIVEWFVVWLGKMLFKIMWLMVVIFVMVYGVVDEGVLVFLSVVNK